MPIQRPKREEVVVFPAASDFRAWLEAKHGIARELFVGYYRKGTGKTAMTYPESVDEALCFGWIDGITYRIDDEVTASRFTPRRKGSNWSATNIARVAELRAAGRMHLAGLRAFEQRDRRKDLPSSLDTPAEGLPPDLEARVRANPAVWNDWSGRPAGYRRTVAAWVMSGKRAETRERRLTELIEACAAGRRVKPLSYGRNRDR